MRLALVSFILLSLATPAYALECSASMERAALNRAARVDFLANLSSLLDRSGLNQDQKNLVLDKASQLKVQGAKIEPTKIGFKWNFNPLRLLGFRQSRTIAWPAGGTENADPGLLSLKLADLTGELLFVPSENPTVFQKSPAGFFRNNINSISTKLYLQYFTLTEGVPLKLKTTPTSVKILKAVLRMFLPWEINEAHSARLDSKTAQLFETGGPQAVYSHLSRVYGPTVAFQYWMRHIKNASQAMVLAFTLYMAPTLKDTWDLVSKENSIQTPSNIDNKMAQKILKDFKGSDVDLIESLKANTKGDGDEAKALAEFDAAYRSENEEKK